MYFSNTIKINGAFLSIIKQRDMERGVSLHNTDVSYVNVWWWMWLIFCDKKKVKRGKRESSKLEIIEKYCCKLLSDTLDNLRSRHCNFGKSC